MIAGFSPAMCHEARWTHILGAHSPKNFILICQKEVSFSPLFSLFRKQRIFPEQYVETCRF